MADKWQQYLAQQAELGGSEIHVAEAGQPGSGAVAASARVVAPLSRPAAPRPRGPARCRRPWQKGAPPIPGPGLAIDLADAGDLLGDGLGTLESLEAIAARVALCTTAAALSQSRTQHRAGRGQSATRD